MKQLTSKKLDIYLHKINLIYHFLLKIFQKFWKFVMLHTSGMPGHAHQK